ncbi:hypothetical protein IQ31_05110 [Sphingobacterium siyangense]|uniref:Uncharacterized protein n=1 Tax=Sphingobacterium siyangense TaxID=459529 RepID=A0A562M6K4_9SPHI|nr:hypothetical protein IQ31_05110 [Sphingobacterium siyangense]
MFKHFNYKTTISLKKIIENKNKLKLTLLDNYSENTMPALHIKLWMLNAI